MALTALVCLAMAWSLAGRALYAARERKPLELGSLATVELGPEHANRYVLGAAPLADRPSVRYRRFGEQGFAVLSPVAGRGELWVEHDVPDRLAGPRFVSPTRFSGRLVPLADLGAGRWGVGALVADAAAQRAAAPVWILLDGATPQSERWALAMALLMTAFGGWNLLGIFLVCRRARPDVAGR
jgi:hypothetical protein